MPESSKNPSDSYEDEKGALYEKRTELAGKSQICECGKNRKIHGCKKKVHGKLGSLKHLLSFR